MSADGIVGIAEDGIRVISENEDREFLVKWNDINEDHFLVRCNQSFNIGMFVGMFISKKLASNDD